MGSLEAKSCQSNGIKDEYSKSLQGFNFKVKKPNSKSMTIQSNILLFWRIHASLAVRWWWHWNILNVYLRIRLYHCKRKFTFFNAQKWEIKICNFFVERIFETFQLQTKNTLVVKLFGLDHENLNSKPRSWLVDNCLCKHHLIVNDFTYKSHDFSQSNILLFLCVLCYYIEIISNFIHFILPYPIIIEITTC